MQCRTFIPANLWRSIFLKVYKKHGSKSVKTVHIYFYCAHSWNFLFCYLFFTFTLIFISFCMGDNPFSRRKYWIRRWQPVCNFFLCHFWDRFSTWTTFPSVPFSGSSVVTFSKESTVIFLLQSPLRQMLSVPRMSLSRSSLPSQSTEALHPG